MTLRATVKHGTGFWCDEHGKFVVPLKMVMPQKAEWIECPICFLESGQQWLAAKVINKPTEYKCSHEGCNAVRKTKEDIETHEQYGHGPGTYSMRENVLCFAKSCVQKTKDNYCQKCNQRYCPEHTSVQGPWGVCIPCVEKYGAEAFDNTDWGMYGV